MGSDPSETLAIRADATASIGAGHVMRCLAIAQAWREEGGAVAFACAGIPDPLFARLAREGCAVHRIPASPGSSDDAAATADLVSTLRAAWLVVDGYHFHTDYYRQARASGSRSLALCDGRWLSGDAVDMILHPGPAAVAVRPGEGGTTARVLSGAPYTLLRKEFLVQRERQREIPQRANRILVTLGGGDDQTLTLRVLEAIAGLHGDHEVVVLLGDANPHRDSVMQAAARLGAQVETGAEDVALHMARADLAVTGAGGTCWEQAFLGLPALLFVVADNQRPNALAAERLGCARVLGGHESVTVSAIERELAALVNDQDARRTMSESGMRAVDGRGPQRVVRAMHAELLTVRRVGRPDTELLWTWANEEEVRRQSFSSDPIPWDDHVKWLGGMLSDPDALMLIGLDAERAPVGTVRFSLTGKDATIGVSVARAARGRGLACPLILRGLQYLFDEPRVERVHAYIKSDNLASVRAFEAAGFTPEPQTEVRGFRAHHLVFRREGHPCTGDSSIPNDAGEVER